MALFLHKCAKIMTKTFFKVEHINIYQKTIKIVLLKLSFLKKTKDSIGYGMIFDYSIKKYNMKRFLYFLILVFTLLAITESMASDPAKTYISEYKDIAINEMHRTGIPASVKLAQALIESDWGRSDLAKNANNHFGIKCGGKWSGKTYLKKDDDYDQEGKLMESCFRVYAHPLESFKNHSDFLTDPAKSNRYGFLFNYKKTDYVSWAYGLQTAGYASDQRYPRKLIDVIEKYKLYELDNAQNVENENFRNQKSLAASEPKSAKKGLDFKAVISQFEIKNAVVSSDMRVKDLAEMHKISVREFITFNEIVTLPEEIIRKGTIVFLENKKRDYHGEEEIHVLKEGETIEYVSHIYGIRSRTLKAINKIKKGTVPAAGTEIRLRK